MGNLYTKFHIFVWTHADKGGGLKTKKNADVLYGQPLRPSIKL